MNNSDDDTLALPADTLALLQEFHTEKDARTKQFEAVKAQAEHDFQTTKLSMDLFAEDWNASQFWYTDATAHALAEQLLSGADGTSAIAVVSAPSVYIALRNILADGRAGGAAPTVRLLEYDRRFEVLGQDYIAYDFQHPLRLPASLQAGFDRILCDPPFLSEDCQAKTALTVRYLARSWSRDGLRLVSCTGERMEGMTGRLYGKVGVRTTDFEVVHGKGLSNEFRCYANFESASWKWT